MLAYLLNDSQMYNLVFVLNVKHKMRILWIDLVSYVRPLVGWIIFNKCLFILYLISYFNYGQSPIVSNM